MGYGLGLNLNQSLEQKVYLKSQHKAELKHLLKLMLKLVHPEFPNAQRGLEGMLIANEFLKGRNASGILIGGLSESIWNSRRKKEDLEKHKDVDVMILDNYENIQPFEKGIDWWIPQREKITLYGMEKGFIAKNYQAEWFENCNGVVLNFNAKKSAYCQESLESGLYLPGKEIITDFRTAELVSSVDSRIGVSDEVIDSYQNKINRIMGNSVPNYIKEFFEDKILSPKYGDSNRIQITALDEETRLSIKRFKSGWD